MTPVEPLLQARDASVVLGGRPAVQETRLAVHRGDLLGLLGPNGAGKTTLLRAVLGLVPLSGGDVLIDGLPLGRARHLVGYVPQRHEFAWDFPSTSRERCCPAVPAPSAGCAGRGPPTGPPSTRRWNWSTSPPCADARSGNCPGGSASACS
ncbi:ATP-binding cassette domain-containing protein [Streptomyces sp. NPDC004629]|uniref:ATP-binding cassette domain-containing protein n=1 Tax=Streptomyces sp. NPDC004629 TaxID=3364705 RepID=UPI00369C4888